MRPSRARVTGCRSIPRNGGSARLSRSNPPSIGREAFLPDKYGHSQAVGQNCRAGGTAIARSRGVLQDDRPRPAGLGPLASYAAGAARRAQTQTADGEARTCAAISLSVNA